jgi:hypothetical protein
VFFVTIEGGIIHSSLFATFLERVNHHEWKNQISSELRAEWFGDGPPARLESIEQKKESAPFRTRTQRPALQLDMFRRVKLDPKILRKLLGIRRGKRIRHERPEAFQVY